MRIENMPFCCTSAILGSFGEHGEPSIVSITEIKKLIRTKLFAQRDNDGQVIDGPKRCIFAISVDPKNIAILLKAGFKIVDRYPGVQGVVHILTFHVAPNVE